MAEVMAVSTLIALLERAVRERAAVAWIDRACGLVVGERFMAASHSVDFGGEDLMPLRCGEEASGRSEHKQGGPALCEGAELLPSDVAIEGFRQTGHYRLILEGRIIPARSQKELLLRGLSAIEAARNGTLERLSREKSRTKRVVARRRSNLNDDEKLATKFSQKILDDWWVFTNNSFPETEKFIRRAAFLAGLHVAVEKLA